MWVEHLYEGHVHIVGFHQHPTHCRQEEEVEKGGHNLQIKHSASYKYIQVDVNNLYKYRVSIGFKEMHNFCTSLLSLLLHKLLLATPPPPSESCTGETCPWLHCLFTLQPTSLCRAYSCCPAKNIRSVAAIAIQRFIRILAGLWLRSFLSKKNIDASKTILYFLGDKKMFSITKRYVQRNEIIVWQFII